MIIVVENSHKKFDVVRNQNLIDVGDESFFFLFRNHITNKVILDPKHAINNFK